MRIYQELLLLLHLLFCSVLFCYVLQSLEIILKNFFKGTPFVHTFLNRQPRLIGYEPQLLTQNLINCCHFSASNLAKPNFKIC